MLNKVLGQPIVSSSLPCEDIVVEILKLSTYMNDDD